MSEQQKEDSQKTVVSFIVGLLIGGLLVWAFSGGDTNTPKADDDRDSENTEVTTDTNENNTDETPDTATEEVPAVATLPVGDGSATVTNHSAGSRVTLESATFPVAEGWVGVREYVNDQLTGLLGVARFSEAQGLVPTEIILQRPTSVGKQYAIVFYTEDGDRAFNLAADVQIDDIAATFTAQ